MEFNSTKYPSLFWSLFAGLHIVLIGAQCADDRCAHLNTHAASALVGMIKILLLQLYVSSGFFFVCF